MTFRVVFPERGIAAVLRLLRSRMKGEVDGNYVEGEGRSCITPGYGSWL